MSLDDSLTKLQQTRPTDPRCKQLFEVAQDVNNLHDVLENVVTDTLTVTAGLLWIYGQATGDVAAATATFTIDGIVSLTPGYTHATDPQTVTNTWGMAISNNTPVLAVYNSTSAIWLAVFDTDTNTGGGGSTYSAGFGLELASTTFSLDDTNYAGTNTELFGSASGVLGWNPIEDWLDDITGYANSGIELLGSLGGSVVWNSLGDWLEGLGDYDGSSDYTQVIGHKGSDPPLWFGMASFSISLADEAFLSTDAAFDTDSHTVLCGDEADNPQETANTFALSGSAGDKVLIGKEWDSDVWHALLGGSTQYGLAVIIGTVPKSTGFADFVNTSTPMLTPGILEGGAYLVSSLDGIPYSDTPLDAVNPSATDFVSGDPPVAVLGVVHDNRFVIAWPDFRAMPGYVEGDAPVGDDDEDLQIIYHSGGEDHFKLDSEDCAAEAE